jgi:non-ribosomal peptide synthetase component E (peptide arylation enzyme)
MSFRSPHPAVLVPDVTLTELVLGGAGAYCDRPAFVDGVSGRVVSFGELCEQVRRVAVGFSQRVGKGDVVAIWAPNLPEYAVVFHAIARLSPSHSTPTALTSFREPQPPGCDAAALTGRPTR